MSVGGIGNMLNGIMAPQAAVRGLTSPTAPTASMVGQRAEEAENTTFGQFLADELGRVNQLREDSSRITDEFIAGRTESIHEVMIAGEKASIALQLAMEVRNKVLEAYQEINRMQI